MIAPWLIAHLETTGRWNADGAARRARVRTHSCGAVVVHGLDAYTCGIPTTADPTPLSALGEALALIAGRPTYTLTRTGNRLELDHRTQHHIAGHPAGTLPADVVAAHQCHTPQLPTLPTVHKPRPPAPPTDGPPPY